MGKSVMLLGAGLALMTATGALAQGAPYPAPGVNHPPMPPAPRMPMRGAPVSPRWGSSVGGHWWGGANAPGGWAAYRRPARGYRLPSYWVAPRFYVTDWQGYGLPQPWAGYNWVRYYDDAVLVDGSGQVGDWRGGLDWDRGGRAYDDRYEEHRGEHMDDRGPPPMMMDGPGPGHHEMRERREIIVHTDGDRYPHGPMGPGPRSWTGPDGRTVVTTTTTGGGYGAGYGGGAPIIVNTGGGAYGYGGSVTTITIQSAPVVTTTTTEVVEDAVTYSSVRRVVRHRVWRPRPCPPPRPHRVWHRPPAVRGS